MARGKHGRSATLRRETAEITTTIEDYKRAVVKLTQERDELASDLARERSERTQERRALRAMVSEGIAPELRARDERIASLLHLAGKNRGQYDRMHDRLRRSYKLLLTALIELGHESRPAWDRWIALHDPQFRAPQSSMETPTEHMAHRLAGTFELVDALAPTRRLDDLSDIGKAWRGPGQIEGS